MARQRQSRFRTIQVSPKDLGALPGHPEPTVSWHSGFRGGAHARPKTTPVHCAARRCRRVAARGACAAASDAGNRLLARRITGRTRACHCSLPPMSRRCRLHRGADRDDRVPLGRGSIRSLTGAGSRAGSTPGERDRDTGRLYCNGRGEGSYHDDTHRLRQRKRAGLVTSFNRPSGNATGVYFLSGGLAEKRLGLIRELLPHSGLVGLLLNPNNPLTEAITTEVRSAASAIGQRIEVLHASNAREIEAGFATLMQKRASAFVLSPDPMFFTRRVQLVTLATRHGIP